MTTYLEDLREGSEYHSAARTIRNEDITAFAGLSGDFSPLHTDDEWVRKNTPFLPSGPRSATLRRATSSIALDASIAINRLPSDIRRRISIVG